MNGVIIRFTGTRKIQLTLFNMSFRASGNLTLDQVSGLRQKNRRYGDTCTKNSLGHAVQRKCVVQRCGTGNFGGGSVPYHDEFFK